MMNKIMKNSIRIFLVILISFAFIFEPLNVYAASDTLGDLEDQLTELKKKKAENDKLQQSTKDEINAKKKEIEKAQEALTQAEADYDKAEEEIEESNEKIKELKETTENILRFLQQMQSQNAYLEYVTGASSMTDMIMRMAAVEQTTNHNQEVMDNLEKLIKENEQLKIDLVKKQQELDDNIDKYQEAVKKLTGNLEEYDQYAMDIDEQVKNAQEQYDTAKKVCSANPATANLGRNAVITDCYNTEYNAGWLKPLSKGTVTSPWGMRLHPTKGYYTMHNGIDIGGNPEGTPVYAAASGIVKSIVERGSCGGNMVYIEVIVGGKKYTTWYYHLLEIKVRPGQAVTQNTQVGTVGGYSTSTLHGGYDTCTTGAHLHFGVEEGWYTYTAVYTNKLITPPGFNNVKGYSFKSRYDYYGK